MIVLVGFMGAGKSTVGELLARRLDRPFVDTDRWVEERAGEPVAEVFRRHGESRFRQLEREVVADALGGSDSVVSLGGGAVMDPVTRALMRAHTVVLLDVDPSEALARIGDASTRPLLTAHDANALMESRRHVYAELARVTVDTSGRSPADIVDEIVVRCGLRGEPSDQLRRVRVETGSASYTVVIGDGLIRDAASYVTVPEVAEKVFVITHPSLERLAKPLVSSLETTGRPVHVLRFPEGETSKTLEVAAGLYDALARASAHRHDLVFTFGGGVVGDVGGFVASTYMRGVPLVHVPTTLLAQVDAAIGGKTGVNLPQGKNLVGTIYQPRVVLCDVHALRDCPEEEIRSGMAEVIKAGFIADPSILDLVSEAAGGLAEMSMPTLVDLVARAVSVKAAIVAADERDRGQRAWLNYGHTFAHAIETVLGFGSVRHGEAVALGMMAAAYAAAELGRIDEELVSRHREVLRAVGLPTAIRLDLDRLRAAWVQDKKYMKGTRFVLLADLGRPEAGIEVPSTVLEKVLERLAREDEQR